MYYRIQAFPDSKVNTVEPQGEKYRIFVREPAHNNFANRAIIRELAKYLDCNEKLLHIIKGHHIMNKIIEKRDSF